MKNNFTKRQIHLDFHTSPDIEGIGKSFSKENFQMMLKKAHADSITVFAKCHHGLCYYPTTVGTMHPNLNFDLTGAMIEAAHEIGVRAPVYITAGWSDKDAVTHPEWRVKDKDGNFHANNPRYDFSATDDTPRPDCTWIDLCLNDSDYCKHIYEITEEVCKRYKDLDGLFYDICFLGIPCHCEACTKGMIEMGLNPESDQDAAKYYEIKHIEFTDKCKAILCKYHKDATIFFNSGGASTRMPQYHGCSTHFEMENLPTNLGWGGYNALPVGAKYFNNTGKSTIGMTGKFHLEWGEFGGFKTKEALLYEASAMATYGVGVSVGDQLHPSGEMDEQTYENIGYAYSYLEKLAPYCYGGKLCTKLGVYRDCDPIDREGISNILIENQLDYNFLQNGNFKDFELVIFPSGSVLSDDELEKLNEYIKDGGKVLFTADALVKNNEFQIECGLKYIRKSEFDCDYIVPVSLDGDLPKTPMLTYNPAEITENVDAKIHAELLPPYFNRTYGKYCSHRNTPYNKDAVRFPAVSKKDNVVYIASKLGTAYKQKGGIFLKRYFISALNLLNFVPNVETKLGSQGRVTLTRQDERYCLNLLYASPVLKGNAVVIEDLQELYNISVKVHVPEKIKRILNVTTNEEITFNQADSFIEFTVPKLCCHALLAMEIEQ